MNEIKRAPWLAPDEHTPPLSTKIQILTVGGIHTIGMWDDEDCVAWYPLNDTPQKIKRRMCEWAKGNKEWRNV